MDDFRTLTPDQEKQAIEMGASPFAVAKWRQRSVPYRWRLKFLAAHAKPNDSLNIPAQPPQEAAE
jgi:hypothetical protein